MAYNGRIDRLQSVLEYLLYTPVMCYTRVSPLRYSTVQLQYQLCKLVYRCLSTVCDDVLRYSIEFDGVIIPFQVLLVGSRFRVYYVGVLAEYVRD